MAAKLGQPGPAKDGFHIHVLTTDDNEVWLVFGVEVSHIPMPPNHAFQLGKAIYEKAQEVDPSGVFHTLPNISVTNYDGQVLLELGEPVSELVLSPSEARELSYCIMEIAARIKGVNIVRH